MKFWFDVIKTDSLQEIEVLIFGGNIDLFTPDTSGMNALHYAISQLDIEMVGSFLLLGHFDLGQTFVLPKVLEDFMGKKKDAEENKSEASLSEDKDTQKEVSAASLSPEPTPSLDVQVPQAQAPQAQASETQNLAEEKPAAEAPAADMIASAEAQPVSEEVEKMGYLEFLLIVVARKMLPAIYCDRNFNAEETLAKSERILELMLCHNLSPEIPWTAGFKTGCQAMIESLGYIDKIKENHKKIDGVVKQFLRVPSQVMPAKSLWDKVRKNYAIADSKVIFFKYAVKKFLERRPKEKNSQVLERYVRGIYELKPKLEKASDDIGERRKLLATSRTFFSQPAVIINREIANLREKEKVAVRLWPK